MDMNKMNIEAKDLNVYITPKDGKYTHVIIFLHGKGDRAKSYIDFFEEAKVLPEEISTKIKIVLLQSPYKKLIGDTPIGTSWFRIFNFPLVSEEDYSFEDAEMGLKVISKAIDEEAKLLNGKYENIFLGGFSQGACLSLFLGLTFEHLLGGVISLSGYLFSQIKIREENKKLNIFVGHGEDDNVIHYLTSREQMKRIEKFENFHCFSYPGAGHTITKQEEIDLNNFLTECMKSSN